jgi:hypothetical protein
MVTRIAAATVAHMPDNVDSGPDEMLNQLITEMMYSPNSDVQLQASQLIGATPFAEPLADALCAELTKPAIARDVSPAIAIVAALPFVGAAAHRRLLEQIIEGDGLPAAVVSAAAWNIGHVHGHSDEQFWARALHRHHKVALRAGTADPTLTLRGLVYALGVSDHRHRLSAIVDDFALAPSARAAASWWRNVPNVIAVSAKA